MIDSIEPYKRDIKILSEMLEEMKAGQVESEEEYEAVDMEVEESEVEMDMTM